MSTSTMAGPAAAVVTVGVCYGACGVAWAACYAVGGFMAGTITAGAGVPAVILACNAAEGTCMAACAAAAAAAAVLPTP